MMVFVFTEVCVHSKVHVAQASNQHLCRDSPGVDFFFSDPLDLTWGEPVFCLPQLTPVTMVVTV